MTVLLILALLLYLSSIITSFISAATEKFKDRAALFGRALVISGFLTHTVALIFGWVELGHFPIVSLKGVCSFIAWAITAYHLIIIQRYKSRLFPIFVMTCVSLLMIISLHMSAPENPIPPFLQDSLSTDWRTQILLPLHVALLLFAYAAFVITVGSGVMYLLQEHELKSKRFGTAFRWLPALNTCDEINHRSMTIGFVSLTLGIITGMIWGKQHDGRYWHNDPKEILTLMTWVFYLTMVHYRLTAGWRGRRVAWLSIGGFIAVLITFIGARAMGGYHVFG